MDFQKELRDFHENVRGGDFVEVGEDSILDDVLPFKCPVKELEVPE